MHCPTACADMGRALAGVDPHVREDDGAGRECGGRDYAGGVGMRRGWAAAGDR